MRMLFTLGCAFVATLAGFLIYSHNKPPRNVVSEAGIPVTATELYAKFTSDQLQANQAYLNKVLQVSGHVLVVKTIPHEGRVVILNTGDPMVGISCSLNTTESTTRPLKLGDKITIKGVCSGYLSDVVLTNGCLVN
ncbi:hypothetical protein FAM09_21315 [Niastella caeni]|uniref:tRNA_anti-like n=1 Tax=Niastella caeni TaxID=2569763 RepID=A0A4S8HPU6_9BACT|nr:hypothetical protein [Niastella caeni]THU35934.1 hypothetical protein FAM09_21315 [Niastella caeni]